MDIPIQNIYYLLSYAWNKLEESQITNVQSMPCETLIDLLAKVLANGLAYVLRRGIDRGYVAYAEETGTLRGKIDVPATLKRTYFAAPRIYCEYDELQYNVLHNQIIKTTLHRLFRLSELERTIHNELVCLYRQLREVDVIPLTKRHFGLVQLHRNNAFYDFLLDICELIHDNLFVDEETGTTKFRDFVRDEKKMAALFEAFVRNFYKREQKTFTVRREDIIWDATPLNEHSHRFLPKMQTDLSLTTSARKIIMDTKYYTQALRQHYDKHAIIAAHLYQLHAYLSNLEALGGVNTHCEGILLYPTVQHELDLQYDLKGHRVSVKTINLQQPWQHIQRDLLHILAEPDY